TPGAVIPAMHTHTVKLLVPVNKKLVIEGGRVIGNPTDVSDDEVRDPDREIEWTINNDPAFFDGSTQPADKTMQLDIIRLYLRHDGVSRVIQSRQQIGQCVYRFEIFFCQGIIGNHEAMIQLQMQQQLQHHNGVQV